MKDGDSNNNDDGDDNNDDGDDSINNLIKYKVSSNIYNLFCMK